VNGHTRSAARAGERTQPQRPGIAEVQVPILTTCRGGDISSSVAEPGGDTAEDPQQTCDRYPSTTSSDTVRTMVAPLVDDQHTEIQSAQRGSATTERQIHLEAYLLALYRAKTSTTPPPVASQAPGRHVHTRARCVRDQTQSVNFDLVFLHRPRAGAQRLGVPLMGDTGPAS